MAGSDGVALQPTVEGLAFQLLRRKTVPVFWKDDEPELDDAARNVIQLGATQSP